ncbi:MAG: 16S rRNA (cytosine(967)-C(5))-methyltransferase RsmB [Epulopiscium sp.]|nr:16S rRNA (cytosine(967)-C(5))-methyltransferase RsmB [Candidatus Epulonipiscium sp.]
MNKNSKVNPRKIAVSILCEIDEEGKYENLILQKNLSQYKKLTSLDKAFITELVKGALENKIHIDYIINQYSKMKTNKMKPWILNVLRIGVYQIKFLTKVPVSAACNESVKITKQRGYHFLSSFVNGVLRNISRNIDQIKYPNEKTYPIQYLSILYSYPTWIIEYWLEQYPYSFVKALCEAGNETPNVTIRCNKLKSNPKILQQILQLEGVEVKTGHYIPQALQLTKTSSIVDLPSFQKGFFQVQDESSMLVAIILDPKPGDTIIDLCSAPGGKATHCAERMNNQGIIVARDIYDYKLHMIQDTAKRLGINIIETENKDATLQDKNSIEKADKILIDAPCSGLGIIRKKPDIKFQKTRKDIQKLVVLQREILKNSWQYVKPGGILVYSTCTITSEENIENILWFTQHYPFVLEDISNFLPSTLQDENTKKGYLQLYPHLHQTDGFFIARLRRKE